MTLLTFLYQLLLWANESYVVKRFMKNNLKKFLTAVAFAAAFVSATSVAHAISFTPLSVALASGTDQSQNDINTAIAAWASDGTLLYKSTQSDGSELGSFSDSYNTTYGTLTTASAIIAYDGPTAINSNPVYALIKDGQLPATGGNTWYFYQINGWNGTDSIDFSGYFTGIQGKISHVSLYGTSSNVPDGGSTLVLVGLAIAGLGLARRKLS